MKTHTPFLKKKKKSANISLTSLHKTFMVHYLFHFLEMLGPPPRFYSIGNLAPVPANGTSNPLRSLSRLAEEGMQQLDLNRNALAEQQLFPNNFPMGFNNDRKMAVGTKNSYVARSNAQRRMSYTPYPIFTQSPFFKSGLAGLEKSDFPSNQLPQLKAPWPVEQFGEYCAELLNRDKHYWTDEETALMLELFEENRDHFNDSKTKKTKIWNVIANIVNKKFNTNVNAEQCSQKYRNLKAEYLKVADSVSEDTGAKKFGAHFKQMKRLLEVEEKTLRSNQSYDWVVRDEILDSSEKYENTKNSNSGTNQRIGHNNNKSEGSGLTNITSEHMTTNSDTISQGKDVKTISNDTSTDDSLTIENQVDNLKVTQNLKVRADSESSGGSVTSEITNEIAGNEDDDDSEIHVIAIPTSTDDHKSISLEANNDSSTFSKETRTNNLTFYHKARQRFLEKRFFMNANDIKSNLRDAYEKDITSADDKYSNSHTVRHSIQCGSTYEDEMSSIFQEYFLSRQRELEMYEIKQKENINCMNRFIEVFRQAMIEKQTAGKF